MSATLTALLLRQSEAGEPATLWGRQAKLHFGRAFDRLLAQAVLVEQPVAETWAPCATCECDCGDRIVQHIDGKYVAACPIDASADTILAFDDLCSFRIDLRRIVEELAASVSMAHLVEPVPGLWGFERARNTRALFVTLERAVVEDPALLAVMRTTAKGGDIGLVAPHPSGPVVLRLQDAADVDLVAIGDAVVIDEAGHLRLDPWIFGASRRRLPRLVLHIAAQVVLIDGTPQPVPAQPLRLLALLAERARSSGEPVGNRAIWDATGREPRDLVRELRDALSAGRSDPPEIRGWIKARRSLGAFELVLDPIQIEIHP